MKLFSKFIYRRPISLNIRIFLSFVGLSVPLVACFLLLTFNISSRWSKDDAMLRVSQTTQSVKNHIDFVVDDTLNISRSILVNDSVQYILNPDGKVPLGISASLSNSIYIPIINKNYVSNVVMVNHDTVVYSTDNTPLNIGTYENIRKSGGIRIWKDWMGLFHGMPKQNPIIHWNLLP